MEFGLLILLIFIMALIPALLVMGIATMLAYIWRRGMILGVVVDYYQCLSKGTLTWILKIF